ncbi:antibiotic biosynthesis monooxygenase [Streptomyces sp. S.PNR 29]|uniref:antibiotic biosynthesis monooxygenase n=1 Tax=Streptomyces sp. S.PNR 29 TaxID=2973805 RepID=UPI0025B18337|nr:antibiotic biosynthesis monooxygenase [Streptomyces sp. S.PNR 29]MDN0194999.1 antibiotic biosynthesis monooxygenase [Streptomyces sp. S.PNR 29]
MTRRTDVHPELIRPEAGLTLFSTWRVGTPERQREAVDAIAATWERGPWPVRGGLGYYVYAGHDGTTLLHHSQWRRAEDFEGYVKTQRQERVDEIDTAVPGIERVRLDRYRRYRSHERAVGDTRVPGLIVTVRIDFEEGASGRRREWVDLVLAALAADPEGHRGLVSAHFHLSDDGTHVLNYAEWESAEAYDEALALPGGEEWERVRTYPAVEGVTGQRYSYALGLVPD